MSAYRKNSVPVRLASVDGDGLAMSQPDLAAVFVGVGWRGRHGDAAIPRPVQMSMIDWYFRSPSAPGDKVWR